MPLNSGISKLGNVNSPAPPAVLPPPIKPGSFLNTGDDRPVLGVSNSIIWKGPFLKLPLLSSNVRRFAKPSAVVIPFKSLAAVTKTSDALGGTKVDESEKSVLLTLANLSGTGILYQPLHLGSFRLY